MLALVRHWWAARSGAYRGRRAGGTLVAAGSEGGLSPADAQLRQGEGERVADRGGVEGAASGRAQDGLEAEFAGLGEAALGMRDPAQLTGQAELAERASGRL